MGGIMCVEVYKTIKYTEKRDAMMALLQGMRESIPKPLTEKQRARQLRLKWLKNKKDAHTIKIELVDEFIAFRNQKVHEKEGL